MVVAAVAAPAVAQQPKQQLEPRTIQVRITGVRNAGGQVGCTLFDGPKGFPGNIERAVKQTVRPAQKGTTVCTFEGVPSGRYAVAVLHDEDSDREMDTGAFGIPKEGYAASNNAHSTFGPPEWSDARFPFDGSTLRMSVKMRY
jgi:uncharacterized protein (DUF2141 family)